MASRLLSNTSFVRTWHVANSVACDAINRSIEGETNNVDTNSASSLGVAEQEIYWLAQHKRAAAIDFLTYEASDEDARKILISAVQSTTGDAHSYTTWDSPDLDIGSDENENGEIIVYRDGRNIFSVDVQKFLVEYNQSTLQPVPEEICRHSDFKQVFQDTVPHSAELVDATNLHSVKVVNGNFLVEAWGDIAAGDIMNIPGCPQSANKVEEPKIIETAHHPYAHDADINGTVKFDDKVACMFVTFDPNCRTREFYAKLQIIGRANNGKPQSFEFHGDKFPQKAFKVYGNKIHYKFQSVGGNDDESWDFDSQLRL